MEPILQETRHPGRISGTVSPFDRDWVRPPHYHGQLELIVMYTGSATLTLGNRPLCLRRGQIAWILPGIPHVMTDFSPDAGFWVIQVEPWAASRALARQTAGSGPFGSWLVHLSHALAGRAVAEPESSSFDRINELAFQCTLAIEPFLGGLLDMLLELVYTRSLPNFVTPESLGLSFWVPSLLAADPQLDRTGLARRVGVSEAYLTRLLRRELGVSFEVQRNRTRLVSFLATVDMARNDGRRLSLLDAAFAAGFGSYSQLHRIFVGTVGFRPTDYVLGDGRVLRSSLTTNTVLAAP